MLIAPDSHITKPSSSMVGMRALGLSFLYQSAFAVASGTWIVTDSCSNGILDSVHNHKTLNVRERA
jgi:hypothetical protein